MLTFKLSFSIVNLSSTENIFVFEGFLATHIPVHESQLMRFGYNVHGHMHEKSLDDPRYLCVSVEHTDYKPIPLYEVRRRLGVG